MEYVAAAMAVIGVVSSLTGAAAAKSAAEDVAREQARLEKIVTDERLVQLESEQRTIKGQTMAGAAGSNVKVGTGSPMEILTEQFRTFHSEKRAVRQAGASRAGLALQRGQQVGTTAAYQGYSQAASSASNAFSLIAQAINR